MKEPLRYKIDSPKDGRYGKIKDTSPLHTFTYTIEISEDHLTNVHEQAHFVATDCMIEFRKWRDEKRNEIGKDASP